MVAKLALLLLLHPILSLALPDPPLQKQMPSAEEQFAEQDRQAAEAAHRNNPPLAPGVWDVTVTDAKGASRTNPSDVLCHPPISPLMLFPVWLSKRSGGLGPEGFQFHSVPLGPGHFHVTSQAMSRHLGVVTANHDVTMQGTQAFADRMSIQEGRAVASYRLTGHWVRVCPR